MTRRTNQVRRRIRREWRGGSLYILGAVCAALFLGAGCSEKAAAFPLSVQAVREMSPTNAAHLSFEERGGEILVSVTDQHGDSHLHKLERGTLSREQALELLKQKQIELEARP